MQLIESYENILISTIVFLTVIDRLMLTNASKLLT